jgi:hypothetical protein
MVLTNNMQQNCSWWVSIPSTTPQISRTLTNATLRYRIQNSPELVPVLSQSVGFSATNVGLLCLSTQSSGLSSLDTICNVTTYYSCLFTFLSTGVILNQTKRHTQYMTRQFIHISHQKRPLVSIILFWRVGLLVNKCNFFIQPNSAITSWKGVE